MPAGGPPGLSGRRAIAGLAVFGVCLAAYLAGARPAGLETAWDSLGTRVLPFAILRDHRPTLDTFAGEFARDRREIGYLENARGHLVSHYPIGAALVDLPLAATVYADLRLRGRTSPRELFEAAGNAEGWSASVISAFAVLLLFVILSGSESIGAAAVLALAFGLATSMWAVSSRRLWQHGPGVLFVLAGYFFLSRPGARPRDAAAAGFFLGFLFGIRPASILFAAAGLAFLMWREGTREGDRSVGAFAAGASAAIAPFIVYNAYEFGNLFGGSRRAAERLAVSNLPEGFVGLFLSPNRGLLFFTPVAIVGLAGMGIALRRWRSLPLLASFSAAAVAYALVHCSFVRWAGGWSFGPRYLTEILPVLALAAPLAIRRMNRRWILASVCLAAASLAMQLDGVTCFGASGWESRMGEPLEAHAWEWRHVEPWEDFIVRTGIYQARNDALPAGAFRIRWEDASIPSVLEAGRPVLASVRFRNVSGFSWPDANSANLGGREGIHAVRLSYRWLKRDSDALVTDYGERSDLAAPLGPGESATVSIAVTPPARPGDYRLQFDLVQELVEWFQTAGAPRLVVPVRVE